MPQHRKSTSHSNLVSPSGHARRRSTLQFAKAAKMGAKRMSSRGNWKSKVQMATHRQVDNRSSRPCHKCAPGCSYVPTVTIRCNSPLRLKAYDVRNNRQGETTISSCSRMLTRISIGSTRRPAEAPANDALDLTVAADIGLSEHPVALYVGEFLTKVNRDMT